MTESTTLISTLLQQAYSN